MKRDKQFILNLTEEEAEQIIKLSKRAKRKPSEFIYLLVSEVLETLNENAVNCGVTITYNDNFIIGDVK